ncbi:MAG: hypothetical protein Q7S56_01870 [Nanoarchaeota archaeon]|nr:hypothetical protein [Nanoarchaeota archaeon]
MNVNSEITREFMKIMGEIRDTPRASKNEVEFYHSNLIGRIDSAIPLGLHHRMLHQAIWLSGFMIYNNYSDLDSAEEGYNDSGQITRFDIWYARNYAELHKEESNGWIRAILDQAEEEAQKYYSHHLNEVVVAL